MTKLTTVRLRAAAVLAGLTLVLSGCFISPGKFTSEMVLIGPDSFTFSYDGEIFFLGLSKLAQMDNAEETFTPSTCYDDETFEERDCTKAELDEQRAEWDAGAADRAAEAKKKAAQMAAIMGGIDPSDPKAAEELIKLLQRQKGWERVVHKGDGLFDVSFHVKGTLGHDFMFPLIEGFPATNPFVQTFGRKNGQLRINAPGFTAQGSDNAMSGMMGGLGAIAGMSPTATNGEAVLGMPQLEGTFTIRTAPGMRILANNTDEGPTATPTGEALSWRITPRTAQFPTALIAAAP